MVYMKEIESYQTEWATYIVFSPENDGSFRSCIDYVKLNYGTIRH